MHNIQSFRYAPKHAFQIQVHIEVLNLNIWPPHLIHFHQIQFTSCIINSHFGNNMPRILNSPDPRYFFYSGVILARNSDTFGGLGLFSSQNLNLSEMCKYSEENVFHCCIYNFCVVCTECPQQSYTLCRVFVVGVVVWLFWPAPHLWCKPLHC